MRLREQQVGVHVAGDFGGDGLQKLGGLAERGGRAERDVAGGQSQQEVGVQTDVELQVRHQLLGGGDVESQGLVEALKRLVVVVLLLVHERLQVRHLGRLAVLRNLVQELDLLDRVLEVAVHQLAVYHAAQGLHLRFVLISLEPSDADSW